MRDMISPIACYCLSRLIYLVMHSVSRHLNSISLFPNLTFPCLARSISRFRPTSPFSLPSPVPSPIVSLHFLISSRALSLTPFPYLHYPPQSSISSPKTPSISHAHANKRMRTRARTRTRTHTLTPSRAPQVPLVARYSGPAAGLTREALTALVAGRRTGFADGAPAEGIYLRACAGGRTVDRVKVCRARRRCRCARACSGHERACSSSRGGGRPEGLAMRGRRPRPHPRARM
jgi:hypothetical protein